MVPQPAGFFATLLLFFFLCGVADIVQHHMAELKIYMFLLAKKYMCIHIYI